MLFPCAVSTSRSLLSTVVVAALEAASACCPHLDSGLDSNICSLKNRAMSALLDLHPDAPTRCSLGLLRCTQLDRMHAGAHPPVGSRPSTLRTWPRSTAPSGGSSPSSSSWLRLLTPAGVAKDAGFTGADAWLAKTTTVSRADAARQVALAAELDSGHDATAEALDAGLVSPEHAAVIVRATGQLPDTVSEQQRQVVEEVSRGEGGPVQSRPAPPLRPPRHRSSRTRPEDRERPRERAHPHRRTSRQGQVLTDAARQR